MCLKDAHELLGAAYFRNVTYTDYGPVCVFVRQMQAFSTRL